MTLEQTIYELETMKTWSKDLSDDEIEALKFALHVLNEKSHDTISRQAAIDAMMKLQKEDYELYHSNIPEGFDGDRAVEELKKLPSVNP